MTDAPDEVSSGRRRDDTGPTVIEVDSLYVPDRCGVGGGLDRLCDSRRQNDARLVAEVRALGCDRHSRQWAVLAERLVGYAYLPLVTWAVNGELRAVAAGFRNGDGVAGLRKLTGMGQLPRDEATSLVDDVLTRALETFRVRAIAEGETAWDPSGGATLGTYFMNCCLQELPGAYEALRRLRPRIETSELELRDHPWCPSPEAMIEARFELARLLASEGPVTRAIVEMKASGFTDYEIANGLEAIGIKTTQGAVTSRLHRLRQRARARKEDVE